MKIRKATLKDLNAIASLYLELIKFSKKVSEYLDSTGTAISKEVIKKAIKGYITHPEDSIVLVAEKNRRIVAFIQATIKPAYRINKKKVVEVIDAYVSEKRKGIGSILLKEVMGWAKKRNVEFVLWEILSKNKIGMKFLIKNKFKEFRIKMLKGLK